MYLSLSHFLVNRVNSLTKMLSACMDRQTSAMPSTKLLSIIEDLNVPVWPLIGSSFIAILSRKQQIKKPTSQMVTRSWDTIPLHLKITLWIFLAPFTITEVTLLTMYVFLTNNAFVSITHGLANAFKKFFLKLQDHLLGWLIGCEFYADMHEEFTDSDWNSICFVGS